MLLYQSDAMFSYIHKLVKYPTHHIIFKLILKRLRYQNRIATIIIP